LPNVASKFQLFFTPPEVTAQKTTTPVASIASTHTTIASYSSAQDRSRQFVVSKLCPPTTATLSDTRVDGPPAVATLDDSSRRVRRAEECPDYGEHLVYTASRNSLNYFHCLVNLEIWISQFDFRQRVSIPRPSPLCSYKRR
jgi:hypothetical protein